MDAAATVTPKPDANALGVERTDWALAALIGVFTFLSVLLRIGPF